MRLIDKDALMETLGIKQDCKDCQYDSCDDLLCEWHPNPVDICEMICDAPEVDLQVVATVRGDENADQI